jgi:hypothetical protein
LANVGLTAVNMALNWQTGAWLGPLWTAKMYVHIMHIQYCTYVYMCVHCSIVTEYVNGTVCGATYCLWSNWQEMRCPCAATEGQYVVRDKRSAKEGQMKF